jgi:hypothetical protein
MMMSSLSGSGMWVGPSGIRVGSAYPGEEDVCDAWHASVRVASNLAGAWRRVMTIPTFDFDVVFNSGFVSSSFTQWYGENTILTNFIFEQNQTPFYTMCSDTNCWGFRPVMYWYLLIGGKAHRHNNLHGLANRLYPRERVYIIRD